MFIEWGSLTIVALVEVCTVGMYTFPSIATNSLVAGVAEDVGMLRLASHSVRRLDEVGGLVEPDESMTGMESIGGFGTVFTAVPIGAVDALDSNTRDPLGTDIA